MQTYSIEHRKVIPYVKELPLLGKYTVQAHNPKHAIAELLRQYHAPESSTEVLIVRRAA